MKIETAIATDPGRQRLRNEDRVCSHRLLAPQLWLVAVADGMGGHEGGDVASTVAIETVESRAGELDAPPPTPWSSSNRRCRKPTVTYTGSAARPALIWAPR